MNLKSVFFILSVMVVFAQCTGTNSSNTPSSSPDPLSFASMIDSAYLYQHLAVLAHDSLAGRNTGTPEIDIAADYLAAHYKKLGLTPGGTDSTFFQPFELGARVTQSQTFTVQKVSDTDTTLAAFYTLTESQKSPLVKQWGGNGSVAGSLVFAGFALEDSAKQFAMFEDIDVNGAWVMVMTATHDEVESEITLPSFRSLYTSILFQKGAKGLLLVAPTEEAFEERVKNTQESFGELNGLFLPYLDNQRENPVAIAHISPKEAYKWLGFMDETTVIEQQRAMLTPGMFKGQALPYYLTLETGTRQVSVPAKNVAAIIPGSDPQLKNELIVLSSHYDHVGISTPDSTGDAIYNGADDDGSGTAALMGVAEALMKAKKEGVGPKRSVMILHVTAEEKGLLGSRYYSDNPTHPIESTIANINIDMIGRIDKKYEEKGTGDYVYIIGADLISSQIDSLLIASNSKTHSLELDYEYNDLEDPNQFYRRSDHWNFGRFGVPFVFFFNGVHDDYHRPGDEIDKIAFGKYAKISQLVYALSLEIANTDQKPIVDNEAFIKKTQQ